MKYKLTTLTTLTFFTLLSSFGVNKSEAITIFGSNFSVSASVIVAGKEYGIKLDPDGIQQASFQISYDTSLFSYNPNNTGLLCDFSNGGNCPLAPSVTGPYTMPIETIIPGGPRVGTELGYNLSVDQTQGLVTLNYDLSANPPTGTGERNFFVLGLTALKPLSEDIFIRTLAN
jgi:hypothetical protein